MIDIVVKLFAKFKQRYNALMATGGQYDWGRNKILEWADYFSSKNATIVELSQAYRLSKDAFKKFPPNEVEFLDLVRQGRYMDKDKALQIACECASLSQYETVTDKWQHPVIFETAMRIGFFALTHEPAYTVKDKWARAYKAVCDEMDAGAMFAIPTAPLLENKQPIASDEFAMQMLSSCKKSKGVLA
ncbi:Uncharacterised protein [Moraxella lacunata]|uniref:Replicative helicase inhibitor G39P N-terminal domain-containing protein n=2 Tax=Moraxella lacunata TaxID=477 RepID=A0A378QG21_MORLA|nr:Uncharacterised protein [Moraxella lacunata]